MLPRRFMRFQSVPVGHPMMRRVAVNCAGLGLRQACENTQQRRLARAIRAAQDNCFARRQGQGHLPEQEAFAADHADIGCGKEGAGAHMSRLDPLSQLPQCTRAYMRQTSAAAHRRRSIISDARFPLHAVPRQLQVKTHTHRR